MDDAGQNVTLNEAASRFLAELPAEEEAASRREINRFVRWFGGERTFTALAPAEVAKYAEGVPLSDTGYAKKLDIAKAFLTYARKKGWSRTNLAVHLKARKGKSRKPASPKSDAPEPVYLTRQGYAELEAELEDLRNKSLEAIEEIRKAAADKDFRENVPLQAARERRGHLEGRIRELEETLKLAVIMDGKQKASLKVDIGDSVIICDLESGEEQHCTLVNVREVDPSRGKISSASPIGQAIMGREQGEVVEVTAPVGILRYKIKQIER